MSDIGECLKQLVISCQLSHFYKVEIGVIGVPVQYHEVIGGLIGRWGGLLKYFFVIVSLAIASVIQLITSARYFVVQLKRVN